MPKNVAKSRDFKGFTVEKTASVQRGFGEMFYIKQSITERQIKKRDLNRQRLDKRRIIFGELDKGDTLKLLRYGYR